MFPIVLRQFSSVHNHEIMSWYVQLLLQVWPCAWYGQSKHNMSSASNFPNYSGQNSQFLSTKLLHIISNSWSVMFWRRNDSKRFRKILKLLILFLEVTKLYTICTNNWQTTSHLVNHLKTPQSFTNLQQYLGRTHKSFGFMTSFTTPPINSLPPSKSDRTLRRSCCVSSWNSTFSGLAKAKVFFSKLHM